MENEERAKANALAFSTTTELPSGFKMREAGYQTLSWMRLLELTIGEGADAASQLSASQRMDQLHAFLFIQSAPIPVVTRAVRTFVKLRASKSATDALAAIALEFIHPYIVELPDDAQALVAQQLDEMGEISAAVVDAKPPKDGKRERPDPN